MPGPQIAVVVASHERPLRLRWLLNALAAQTLSRDRFEVVVCHDSRGSETEQVLSGHPLARNGTLRWTSLPAGSAAPGANRNAALKLVRAPTVVFTDDDCRPPEAWLERVLAASLRDPDAVIQGAVAGDPDEEVIRRAPYPRTQSFATVPRVWAECCNIVYPARLLAELDGFAEDVAVGEDTDLNQRAIARGARYIGAPQMLTFHAIEELSLRKWVRQADRWSDLPVLFKRHPDLRGELFLGAFWKREHALLVLAAAAIAAARTRPATAILALPWALARSTHGTGFRGRARQVAGLPGWAAIDLAELLALLRGSLRHRSLVL